MRFVFLFLYFFSLIILFTNAQDPDVSLVIAKNDGTLNIGYQHMQYGIRDKKGNFFYSTLYPDNVSDKLGDFIFYEVILGSFTDYVIPSIQYEESMRTYSVFNSLGGGVRDDDNDLRVCTYSPVSPLDASFDGSSRIVPNYWETDPSIYGTSFRGFIKNGTRDCISGWGATDIAGGPRYPGGCCFENLNKTFSWGLPYTIIGHKFAIDYIYLGVKFSPSFYYSGQKIIFNATVLDGFGRTIPEALCKFNLTRSDTHESKTFRGYSFSTEIDVPKTTDSLILELNASMVSPEYRTFWYSNKSTYKVKITNITVHRVKSNGTLLDYKAPVTRMLRYTNPADYTDVVNFTGLPDYRSVRCSFLNNFEVRNVRPRDQQSMDLMCKHPTWGRKSSYDWGWKSVSNDNGLFGGGITKSDAFVQFFAFAFHNPIKQVINVITLCSHRSICDVYINGAKPAKWTEYEAGWYQVFAKVVSRGSIHPSKGFKISFEAQSLVVNDAVMDLAPYEEQPKRITNSEEKFSNKVRLPIKRHSGSIHLKAKRL